MLQLALLGREDITQMIKSLQQLQIRLQMVGESAVEQVAANLGQAGRAALVYGYCTLAVDTDNQHPVGPQMQRRTDGCRLAYRTITIEFVIHAYRRKNQWNCGAGTEVINIESGRPPGATKALPWLNPLARLIKSNGFGAMVRKSGNRNCGQLSSGQRQVDTGKIQFAQQQRAQRRIVQQRRRPPVATKPQHVLKEKTQ